MSHKRPIDITDIEAKLGPAKHAQKRTRDLSLRLLREFQCPRCQIESERRSLLVSIQRANNSSILRCYCCGGDFAVPDGK